MKSRVSFIFAILSLILLFDKLTDGQVIDTNSTNFRNIQFSKFYSLNRYHSYLFDFWKTINFDTLFQKMSNMSNTGGMTEDEMLENIEHDDDSNEGYLAKIASFCGKIRNMSSPYISKDCFNDLDFIACGLANFLTAARGLLSGKCDRVRPELEAKICVENLKQQLHDNMWVIQMIDSFGKVPAGINMGGFMTLGRYSDCRKISVPRQTHGGEPFEGAYCRATFRIPLPETADAITRQCHGRPDLINAVDYDLPNKHKACEPAKYFANMKWGLCAPSTCDTKNMTVIFRYRLPPTKYFCNVTVVCEKKVLYPSTDKGFLVSMFLLSIFLILVALGTVYDYLVYQKDVESLPDDKYAVVKGDKAQEFSGHDLNGSKNDIIMYSGRTKVDHYRELKWYYKLILAFSAYTNINNVLNVDDNPKEIRCVQAVRTLSMAWLISILAHIYIITYIDNTKVLPKFISNFWYQSINNGSFVSDTFLLLSGFLLTYWFVKKVHSMNDVSSPKFWLKYYARRFIRIFPAYAVLLLCLLLVWKFVIRGPLWTGYFFNMNSPLHCWPSIFTNFFFVNNFVLTDSPCLPITQHLALDMQLYVFAPLLLICFIKFPKVGFLLSAILIVLSCLFQTLAVLLYGLPPSMMGTADVFSLDKPLTNYYNAIFIKPYMRWNAFIVGMLLGHVIAKKPDFNAPCGKKLTKFLWILSILTCFCVVFGLTGYSKGSTIPGFATGLYVAFSRLFWSLAVASVIFLCITNRGGVVEWFFSQPFWAPLSRLSYSAFLVSPLVVLYAYATSRSALHMNSYNMLYFSIGCLVLTYLTAFICHLIFEAPFLALRNLLKMFDTVEYVVSPSHRSGLDGATGKYHQPVQPALVSIHQKHSASLGGPPLAPHHIEERYLMHPTGKIIDPSQRISPLS